MSEILVVNLKRFGDIFSSGHIVHSLQSRYPHCSISILTLKEFKGAAESLKGITAIYTIDRKKIEAFKKNKIFSHAFGIETLIEDLAGPMEKNWMSVINISQDKLSSVICGLMNAENKYGVILNEKNTHAPANAWSLVANEIHSKDPLAYFNHSELYHEVLSLKWSRDGMRINSIPEHNEKAYKHLNELRKSVGYNNPNLKLVGIQIKTSSPQKDIPAQTVEDFIGLVLDDPNTYPVLLIGPFDEEREMADRINEKFEDSLLIVESDFTALPSVLVNLDGLVTPDTSIKHMADLLETPILEVCNASSPDLKQAATTNQSLILSYSADKSHQTLALDMYRSLKVLTEPKTDEVENLKISDDSTLYRVYAEGNRVTVVPIAGQVDWHKELRRTCGKEFILDLNNEDYPTWLRDIVLKKANLTDIRKWHRIEKEGVLEASRKLLNAIRSLKHLKVTGKNSANFVKAFDDLLQYDSMNLLSSLPVMILRGRLDQIESSDRNENLEKIEALFFSLKAELQRLSSLIQEYGDIHSHVDKTMSDNRLQIQAPMGAP